MDFADFAEFAEIAAMGWIFPARRGMIAQVIKN